MKKTTKQWMAGVLASSFLLGFGTWASQSNGENGTFNQIEGEGNPLYSATLDEISFSNATSPVKAEVKLETEFESELPTEVKSELATEVEAEPAMEVEIEEPNVEEVAPVQEQSIFGEDGRLVDTSSETATLSARSAYFDFYQTYGVEKAADVFYNGKALSFVDAFPLIEDGTTFVPLAVLTEVIGATVDYDMDTRVVTIHYKGKSITFELNDTGYYINGGDRQELPNAIFTAKDRSMVPVRFITEALELSLYWNASLKQVIVADLDALKNNSNTDFQLLNSFLTYTADQTEGKNLKVVGDLSYGMHMNGKNVYVDVDLQAVGNENVSAMNYDMSFNVDLSDFDDDIRLLLQEMSAYPEDTAAVSMLLDNLSDFDLNYIFDMEGKTLYLQSNLISRALPAFTVATGLDASAFGVNETTWFTMNMDDIMLSGEQEVLYALLAQTSNVEAITSVNDLIDAMMEMTRYYNNHDVNFYNTLEMLMNSCGDSKFTQSGDAYKQTGNLTSGNQSVAYELQLNTDGNKQVTAYDATLTFKDGSADSTVLTLSQPNSNTLNLSLETTVNEISVVCKGSLQMSGTTETAISKPNGSNFFNMSFLF